MLLISDVSALKKAEQVRSEFTANVSHELKTPLTSIKGMTEMLAQDMVPEQEIQKRFLTMIGVEVDRLIGLINHILKFSELESCVIEQPKASTKVSTVLQEVCEVLKPAAQSAKIELELLCHGGEIAMDPERFRELISNLLDNAIKYNVEKGSVYVSVSYTHLRRIVPQRYWLKIYID